MIIKTTLVRKWNAGATAIWPLILIDPKYYAHPEDQVALKRLKKLLDHEFIHHKQQRRWYLWGFFTAGPLLAFVAAWGFTWPLWAVLLTGSTAQLMGVALWYFLYFTSKEFVRKVETEAYRDGSLWNAEEIAKRLAKPPYNIKPKA